MRIYPVLGGDDPYWPGRACIDAKTMDVLVSFAGFPKVYSSLSTLNQSIKDKHAEKENDLPSRADTRLVG